MYEFQCGKCGGRFEALAAIGTETEDCRSCGAAGARRMISEPAPPLKLVKTGAGNRRQEGKNRVLRDKTKADFKRKLAERRGER